MPCFFERTNLQTRAKQDGLSITVQYDMAGKLFRGDQVVLTESRIMESHILLLKMRMDIGPNVLPGKI